MDDENHNEYQRQMCTPARDLEWGTAQFADILAWKLGDPSCNANVNSVAAKGSVKSQLSHKRATATIIIIRYV